VDIFLKYYLPFYLVLYFSTAFFLRSYLQYKKTGISPITFGRNSDSAHDYIGIWFKLVLVLVFAHGFIYRPAILPAVAPLEMDLFRAAGVILTLVSYLFTLYAQKAMEESWRIGIDEEVKTRLVTTGPFGYSRNPIFLAMLVTLTGLFLITPTYIMGVLWILSYLLINIQVRLEEEYLVRTHGKEYINYRKRVGRFLPTQLVRKT